jgi:protein disulfide-isomerase A1
MLSLVVYFAVLVGLTSRLASCDGSSGATVLTDDNYASLVESSSDLWLLEFYAPWCGHCKRLRPVLDELAQNPSKKFPMRIGVMDATAEKAIPGKFGIKSYPTIKFYKDGVYGKYEGARSIEGFSKFSERMHGPPIALLEGANLPEQLSDILSSFPVVFLLTYTGTSVPVAFQSLAKQMQAEATFAAVHGTEESIAKLEDGKVPPKLMDLRGLDLSKTDSATKIESFVKANNHPLVSALDSHNFKQLGSLGKVMVIAIVDYKDKILTKRFTSDLETAASSSKHADRFVFGHLDGVHWSTFVKQYEASVPALMFLDLSKEMFHTKLVAQDFIASADQIQAALSGVAEGSLTMKLVPSKGIVAQIKTAFDDVIKKLSDYYPYSLLCALPIVLLVLSFAMDYPQEDSKKKKKE